MTSKLRIDLFSFGGPSHDRSSKLAPPNIKSKPVRRRLGRRSAGLGSFAAPAGTIVADVAPGTPWTENAATLKLDPAAVAEFGTLTSDAQAARQALVAAKQAYQNALGNSRAAISAMRTSAGAQVSIIRATAKSAADPQAIYSLGSIPGPAEPQPAPAPGTPTTFKVELLQGGSIRLRFLCPNPPRTGPVTYRVERQVAPAGAIGQAPFEFFVNAKERSFTDETIPLGTAQVVYRVTAQTTTNDGDPAVFGVQFGAGNQATVFELPQGSKEAA